MLKALVRYELLDASVEGAQSRQHSVRIESRISLVSQKVNMLEPMEIEAPAHFVHAGDLDPRLASKDPRRANFSEPYVDIDLRKCEFIQPAAVLWCLIYGLLAAQINSTCRLLVADHLGVATYLRSVELFRILQESGVEVDDREVGGRPAAPF